MITLCRKYGVWRKLVEGMEFVSHSLADLEVVEVVIDFSHRDAVCAERAMLYKLIYSFSRVVQKIWLLHMYNIVCLCIPICITVKVQAIL